jgi:hypothetical protein
LHLFEQQSLDFPHGSSRSKQLPGVGVGVGVGVTFGSG